MPNMSIFFTPTLLNIKGMAKINKASDTLKFVGKDFVSFLNDSLTFSSVVKAQFNNDKIKGDPKKSPFFIYLNKKM